ncbi:MAG: efflux RND transporter periplasmic adaptor subunit [Candidatus Delongbacteria bacterium]|jgi:membrane fusion protein (multidrug efflux system)|nr:efflux RND transporter periplasmic adaptor subunit [Candidatus Delongbacteria bacterium]
MKKTKIVVWIMVVAGMTSACKPEMKREVTQEDKIQPVKIAELTRDTIERQLSYTANLEAWEVVCFAPAKPGRIKKIFVDEGDRITKDQKLVQMDQTELTQALIQLDNTRTNFQRMDTLYDLNSISKQQYDQAKTQFELAKANIEFLQENTSLEAPFTGIVTAKHYEDGEMYSGAPNTQAGKAAVVTLMQISPLKVMVSISERQFPYIKKGMKAQIISDIYPNELFSGKVYRVYPTIDPATRTFQTEIKIDNPNEKLRPGMFVTVHITIKDEATMLVPAIAIIKQEGTNNRYVFMAEDGTARKIPVKIGDRFDDQFEIISDELETGMDLIVAGQANLRHGDSIKIKK